MSATNLSIGDLAIIQVNSEDSDDPYIAGTQNMSRDTLSFVLMTDVGVARRFTSPTVRGTAVRSAPAAPTAPTPGPPPATWPPAR
jgi:hypothetical protein